MTASWRFVMKKKFTFVNQNYEMLNKKTKEFTYSSENVEVKPQTQKTYRYIAIIVASLALLIAAFFSIEKMKPSERGIGQDSLAEPAAGTGKPTKEQPQGPGMPEEFKPQVLTDGASASYELDLKMPQENKFEIQASIDVTNASAKGWNQVSFYFFPNLLGDMARDQCHRKVLTWAIDKCLNETGRSDLKILGAKVNGEESEYEVEGLQINVPLKNILPNGGQTNKHHYFLFLFTAKFQ